MNGKGREGTYIFFTTTGAAGGQGIGHRGQLPTCHPLAPPMRQQQNFCRRKCCLIDQCKCRYYKAFNTAHILSDVDLHRRKLYRPFLQNKSQSLSCFSTISLNRCSRLAYTLCVHADVTERYISTICILDSVTIIFITRHLFKVCNLIPIYSFTHLL